MAKEKQRLGRGLEGLLNDCGQLEFLDSESGELQYIDIQNVALNALAEKAYADIDVQDLALSIDIHGILQPLLVSEIKPKEYEIIAGNRRYLAAKLLNLASVPCLVKTKDSNEANMLYLIDKMHCQSVKPLQIATMLDAFMKQSDLTEEQLADKLTLPKEIIQQKLQLLALPEMSRNALEQELITEKEAYRWTAQQEEEANEVSLPEPDAAPEPLPSEHPEPTAPLVAVANDDALREKLQELLGISVEIQQDDSQEGQLVLKYQNTEQLNKVLQFWGLERVDILNEC